MLDTDKPAHSPLATVPRPPACHCRWHVMTRDVRRLPRSRAPSRLSSAMLLSLPWVSLAPSLPSSRTLPSKSLLRSLSPLVFVSARYVCVPGHLAWSTVRDAPCCTEGHCGPSDCTACSVRAREKNRVYEERNLPEHGVSERRPVTILEGIGGVK